MVEDKVIKVDNKELFKYIRIFVYILVHKSLVRLSDNEKAKYRNKYQGSCRTDILSVVIDNILNKSTIFGLKELKFEGIDMYKPDTKRNEFYGRVLSYTAMCENTGGDICE